MKKTYKKIFICSRLRGEHAKNLEIAKSLCRIVAMMGHVPIAPHVYFTQFLSEENENERKLGISMGIELLSMCDEIWVFGLDGVSEGMEQEIDFALANKIPIKYLDALDYSPTVMSAAIKPLSSSARFEYNEGQWEQKRREQFD